MALRKILFRLVGVISLIFAGQNLYPQTIPATFFGQNAWMPDTIGSKVYYGKVHQQWGKIKESGASIIRYGGIGPDENKPTNYQYIRMIDSIRANGMEPVIQVPYHKGAYTAAQAAAIVQYINVTKGRNIKYWIIANEPNLGYGYTAGPIAQYTKAFASAMKAVDPTIKTVGPELAWYDHPIVNALTTPGGPYDITGKDANGRYYLDVFAFHTYPFNGTQTRAQVISKLMEPYSLKDCLSQLNSKLAAAHTYHGRTGSPIKIAITEANVNYVNSPSDNLYANGANSFVGAQFWAEMMAISLSEKVEFINFWSVVEGNNQELNIGYLDRTNQTKKPSFYHFQMMAKNFKGTFINGTDNQANVKAFASKGNNEINVMILNQDQANNFNYTVRLDNNSISTASALKININAAVGKEHTETITNQSTLLLKFDLSGNLIQKTEYKMVGHADANLPPTVTNVNGGTAQTGTPLSATITAGGPVTFCTGGSVVLTANAGTNFVYQWKKDGVAIPGATSRSYTATASGEYQIKITQGTVNDWSAPLKVTVNPGITATITAAGSTSLANGGSVVLNANTGTGFTYQWKKNGVNISGATGASYTANAAGSYTVYITKSGGCGDLSNALTVNASTLAATITASGSTTICQGSMVTLTANQGTGYAYQWQKNGANISGATSRTYNANAGGSYRVKITANGASVYSSAITVTVGAALVATITASATTIPAGGNVTLTANSGTGITYQWRLNGVNIQGATAATYKASGAGAYTVVETKSGCTATSNVINLNTAGASGFAVITPAGPTTFPKGQTVALNANTGTGYKYQWIKDGKDVFRATGATFLANKSGNYSVRITNGTAVSTSPIVLVNVVNLVANINVSGSTNVPAGQSVVMTANRGAGYVYQWKKNGVAISGATQISYTATTSGAYQVKITAGGVNAWSAPVNIVIGGSARFAQGDTTQTNNGEDKPATEMVKKADTPADKNGNAPKTDNPIDDAAAKTNTAKVISGKTGMGDKGKHDPKALARVTGGKGGGNPNPNGNLRASGVEETEEAASTESLGDGQSAAVDSASFLNGRFGVNVYPNPTDGPLTLDITTQNTQKVDIKVELVNMIGQIVLSKTPSIENGFGEFRQQLDPSIASGTYFVRVTEGEQVSTTKLVVTQ